MWEKHLQTVLHKDSTTLATNCTHGSLFGLCNEQYFVQIRAATKKMFYTGYISSPIQGASKCTYCPHCFEFVYVHKWCTDSIIFVL